MGLSGKPYILRDLAEGPYLEYIRLDFGVSQLSQSIGNCSEIDLDGFSAREVPYSQFFNYFEKFRFCFLKFRGPGMPSGRTVISAHLVLGLTP